MLSLLNGLWIIDPNGLCLLHQDFSIESKEKIDETMFSGFLTAILSFTQDLVNDTIERIQMGEREIHYQSFGIFAVAVSANKSKKKAKDLSQYITKVGNEFMSEYGEELRKSTLQNMEKFAPFSIKIDEIFGLKGVRVAQVQRTTLLEILQRLKAGELPADQGVTKILALYNELDNNSKKFMKQALRDVEDIFKKSELLTPDQRKQFQKIVKEVGAQLKAEKWLSSF